MSSNNNGSEIENGVEASREQEPLELEREDNGRWRNVEDKTSPDQDVLMNELQMQKTHDLYCPNCIHKVTETAKFFEKGEATFPYNKQRFLLGFVIVLSFKYPFIYLPWLYSNTPDGSEPTQRDVDETPRIHVLDCLWLLLVVVLVLLSATVLWVILSPTRSLPLSPPLPSSHINQNLRVLIPDPEDATEIHGHLKPHVYDVLEEDVTEIGDCLKSPVPNSVVDDRPIMPSQPALLPPPPPHSDESLTLLVTDLQKIPEDITETHNHLKPHVLDVLEEDIPIQTSPPSPPLPPPPLPPHTNGSLTTLIPGLQKISEDVSEIRGRLKPHVLDVVVNNTPILASPSSLPSLPLPPPSPHTNISSTVLIPDQQKVQEDVTVIRSCLKPHVVDVVEETSLIQPSLPPPIPLPPPQLHTNATLAILPPKIKDATKINGHLKPHITALVEDDSQTSFSSPPSLQPSPPSPSTNGSLAVLGSDPPKIEDATKIHGHLKPHITALVEDDSQTLFSSPASLQPPPPSPSTNGSLTVLVFDSQNVLEDITEIHGPVNPHIVDVVEEDKLILPSPPSPLPTPQPSPHTNGSLQMLIPDQQKIQEDVTFIHGHEADVVEEARPIQLSLPPPSPPHTDGRLALLIPDDPPKIEDATKIYGPLKPHITVVVEDDSDSHISSSLPPSLPPPPPSTSTNGSLTVLGSDLQNVVEDITEIHGRLNPDIVDVIEEDRPISPSPASPLPTPHTNGSLKILIPDQQKIQEDVTYIHGHLKPHEADVVEEAIPNQPSFPSSPPPPSPPSSIPPPQQPPAPHINGRLAILVPDPPKVEDAAKIHGHLKPHITVEVNDDSHISPSLPPSLPSPPLSPSTSGSSTVLVPDRQQILGDTTETHGRLNPHIVDVVEEDRSISPSPPSPLPIPQPSVHTNESFTILIPDLKPYVPDVVEDDSHILPSSTPSLPLPPPRTNGSLTVSVSDQKKVLEDITEIHDRPNPHLPDVVEEERPIIPSSPSPLPTTQPPPHSNESLTKLISDQQKVQEDVTDIHGRLKPHVPDVVKDDRPILPSLPQILTPGTHKILEDITEIHDHLKSHASDVGEDDIHNTSSLPPPLPPPPSSSHTNVSLTVLISGLQKTPENATEIDGRLKPHVPDVVEDHKHIPSSSPPLVPAPHINESVTVLVFNPQKISKDVTEIQDRLKPHVPNVAEEDEPISPTPAQIKKKGGWIPLSWVIYFPSNRTPFVISLLLLVILALCLLSISWKRRTKTKNAVAKVDVSNGEAQDSTNKPEDVTGVENNEDVASQNDDLSTTDHKANVSGTETSPVISPPTTLAKLIGILWKHIVVQVQNVLLLELDIVKSIVYGGLIESITSFGVVSSAAAFGTSTLNVLALGLANLFSGLFLIIYNLFRLLMYEPFDQSENIDHAADVKATDPYEELLGNRKKVILHCVVVVVSFIFFGVISPLFYGFSFKITDNGHYEAAVFVAGSLVCVISLSFAKAYAFGMDKLKSVAAYTGIAISGSALSFIASQHAKDVFAKYDFHKLASDYLKE